MNIKRKALLCIAIALFCTLASLQAQERYLSQSDIDNLIANFEAIGNDEIMEGGTNVEFSEFETFPTTATFIAALGDFKGPFSKLLQKHGLNRKYAAEAFYTIMMGGVIAQIDDMLELMVDEMLQMGGTEEERQLVLQMLQSDETFAMFAALKDSIHPDDLSLIKENSEALNQFLSYYGLF